MTCEWGTCDYVLISIILGTVGSTSTVYRRPKMRVVRSLMDQLKTTTGAFQVHANEEQCLRGMVDPQLALRQRRKVASETKTACERDHTKELVKLTGFFETVGAENIYMSETHKFFREDPKYKEAVRCIIIVAISHGNILLLWSYSIVAV